MLQTPSLIFSIVLASAYAVLFHLWRGRGLRNLLFLWLVALAGFAAGHLLGAMWDLVSWTIGAVHVIEATVGALLFLVIARWLVPEKRTS
jgi:hypothetical protein